MAVRWSKGVQQRVANMARKLEELFPRVLPMDSVEKAERAVVELLCKRGEGKGPVSASMVAAFKHAVEMWRVSEGAGLRVLGSPGTQLVFQGASEVATSKAEECRDYSRCGTRASTPSGGGLGAHDPVSPV